MNPDDQLNHPPADNGNGGTSDPENESLPDLSPDEWTSDNEETDISDTDTASMTSEETDSPDHSRMSETDRDTTGDAGDPTGTAHTRVPAPGNINTSRQWHTLVDRTLQDWMEDGNRPPSHAR